MNKPIWHSNLEEMSDEALTIKRSDIVGCIKGAKSQESRDGYEYQLHVLDSIVSVRKQLVLNFERCTTGHE